MRKWVLIGFVLIAAAGVIAWRMQQGAAEPTYEGKTLTQWVFLLDSQTEHKAENDAAAQAFGAMGKNALPGLIRILHKKEAMPILVKVKDWAVRFHLLQPPVLQLNEWQHRAARACCILGGWNDLDIRAAIPDLAYHLTNTVSSWQLEPFAWGLVYSGPEGLSVVTNAMAHAASAQVREEAARSLWISPKIRTPEIASALVSATKDPDASVRVTALLSLKSFSRKAGLTNIIVPGVLGCLQDTNSQVRRWTVDLLSAYASAPGVDAALKNMLNDPDSEVQKQAERALQPVKSTAGK